MFQFFHFWVIFLKKWLSLKSCRDYDDFTALMSFTSDAVVQIFNLTPLLHVYLSPELKYDFESES